MFDILELMHLRFILENDFKYRNKQLEVLDKNDKDVFVRCVKEYKNRDLNILKKLCDKNEFVCEICGRTRPKILEGADPNTCRDCNPERLEVQDDAEWYYFGTLKETREYNNLASHPEIWHNKIECKNIYFKKTRV